MTSISERRQQRVRGVLEARLGSVVVVLEAVRRRHNASAILRSCEAFGLHEVHLITGGFRVSKGAARGAERWLEVHRHDTTAACVDGLRARGFTIFAAHPAEGATTSPETISVVGPVALLLGSELSGVTPEALDACDGTIAIPMRGLTESLNVSVAAACLIMRVAERRRAAVGGGDLAAERVDGFVRDWFAREAEAQAGRVARSKLRLPPGS